MISKILVPLDGSDFSECSLEYLKEIATGCHASEVVLLTVVEPLAQYYMSYRISDDLGRKTVEAASAGFKVHLSKLADELKKEGMAVKFDVIEGRPADEILDYATKNNFDLIIMSTHGRSGVSRFAFGSVAEKVIRSSAVPVLSISPSGCRVNIEA